MSQFDFDPIFAIYPSIIAEMPARFNSHQFILRLAQQHQATYVEALYAHRNRNPFQAVHNVLSKRLRNHPQLVQHIGEVDSTDIFGHSNRCAEWSKV